MRKINKLLLAFLCFFITAVPVAQATDNSLINTDLAPNARSAILMDASTGEILYEKNSHEKLPPASVTKVMTMLLLMEQIHQGKISLDDQVQASEYAASMGGSQIFLAPGEKMSVSDLLKAIAIASANDASVALAERIGDTEAGFVKMMNDKAKQLGLKSTHFVNTNGLPAPNHHSSAYDIAVMSRELLKYPEITRFTGIYQDMLRAKSGNPFSLFNTNKLVRHYEGVDGLKTGFTDEAKYCLAATAKKGYFRVIAVVLGEPEVTKRNQEITKMIDHAFNNYKSYLIFNKGEKIARKEIDRGEKRYIEIHSNSPFAIVLKKGESTAKISQEIQWKSLEAPIKKGDVLGTLVIKNNGKVVTNLKLISNEKVAQASLWTTIKRLLGDTTYLK